MNITIRSDRAFTITELLAVVAALALLAIIVLPAGANVQNKDGRADCANNLRQIGQDSMIYAGENNGLLPVCTFGAGNIYGVRSNNLTGIWYTWYVFNGNPYSPVATNTHVQPAEGIAFQNLGYLFQAGLAGNGGIFYCPAQWGTVYGANQYSPLLTTDGNGSVQSSYYYNPRLVNAAAGNVLRRYQRTSQLEPHRLFAVDSILAGSGGGNPDSPGTGVNPLTVAHARDHGWNVLFTDGSVQFARLSQSNNAFYTLVTQNLVSSESEQSWLGYDQTFNFLEQDH